MLWRYHFIRGTPYYKKQFKGHSHIYCILGIKLLVFARFTRSLKMLALKG